VYITEPVSRWLDNTDYYHFEYGFIDFAIDTIISLGYQQIFSQTKTWTAPEEYFDIIESNIAATAVVFDETVGNTGFAQATALATPGNPGIDIENENCTHTVFIDEATGHF
jgi:hypothetical protein